MFIPLCIAAVAAGQSPTQLVIKTGDAVPGNPSSTFGDVRPGAIDNANRVLLWANFEDTESVTGQGLFEWSEGTVTPIVVRGDAAPGVAGGTFRSFISTVAGTINDQGDVAFLAFVELAGREQTSVLRSVWLRSGEGLTLLALEGGILPGLAEGQELIGTPTGPVLNQQGVAVFRASIVDAEEPTAVVGAGI
ncbi:MAG: choice-of-anchor tandem repeat NxxGxxAF-containing protein, partial [Pseudomonadota bacterium]